MDVTTWVLVSLIIILGGIVMAATGFGFALVISSLLIFFLDPKSVIIYNLFLGFIICLPVFWQSRGYLNIKRLTWLGVAGILGLPIGIYVVSQIVTPTLKLIIAGLVVIFAILLAVGYSYKFKNEDLGSAIVGFIGGVLMPSTGLGGPPVVLFLVNQGYDKNAFRANMTGYLIISGLGAFTALGLSGVVSGGTLLSSLAYLPALAIGYFLGIKVASRLNTAFFRKIVTIIVTLTGLTAIVTTLLSLFK